MDAADDARHGSPARGLSQRELSRRTGIPQATISRIENRVVSPTFDTLEPLISACGLVPDLSEKTSDGVESHADPLRPSGERPERLRYAVAAARRRKP